MAFGGSPGPPLGLFWLIFGCSWVPFGAQRLHMGAQSGLKSHTFAHVGTLGSPMGTLGSIMEAFGCIFASIVEPRGAFLVNV